MDSKFSNYVDELSGNIVDISSYLSGDLRNEITSIKNTIANNASDFSSKLDDLDERAIHKHDDLSFEYNSNVQ
jgi:gas vesicle protein